MNAIAQLMLMAMGMIVGLGMGLSGIIMGFATNWRNLPLSLSLIIIGFSIGGGLLWYLLRLNRIIQQNALRKALLSTESILFIWATEKGEQALLTMESLFVGYHHYPFDNFYQKLTRIDISDAFGKGTFLEIEFLVLANYSGARPSFSFRIPDAQAGACLHAVQTLQQKYLPVGN